MSEDKFEYVKEDGKLVGIRTKNQCIEVIDMGGELIHIVSDRGIHMNRDAIAEFFWAVAIFLDSEERYRPTGEMVGINYE